MPVALKLDRAARIALTGFALVLRRISPVIVFALGAAPTAALGLARAFASELVTLTRAKREKEERDERRKEMRGGKR